MRWKIADFSSCAKDGDISYQLLSPVPRPGITRSRNIAIALSMMAAGLTCSTEVPKMRVKNRHSQ
jgi:hypothetical protein